MAFKKKNAVAVVEENLPAVSAVPSFLEKGSKRGTETLTAEDMVIPRLYILQGTHSDELQAGHRMGTFYHNVLETTLADEDTDDKELTLIPILTRIQYTLWNPRHMGGGALATASDGVNWDVPNQEFKVRPKKDDPYEITWKIGKIVKELTMPPLVEGGPMLSISDFGTSDYRKRDNGKQQVPAATKGYFVAVRCLEHFDIGPMIIILQKTSETIGKKWNTKIRLCPYDSFAQRFTMSGIYMDEGEENKFWVYNFAVDGLLGADDEAMYRTLEDDYQMFKELQTLNVKDADDEAPTEGVIIEGEKIPDEMS